MEFCHVCQNMLFLRTDGQQNLVKYCKRCKSRTVVEASAEGRQPYKISHSLYCDDDLLYLQHQNPYLRFDPTLPRICDPDIRCPVEACQGERVLYIKYHPTDLKYLYCCDHCGHCGLYEEFKVKK